MEVAPSHRRESAPDGSPPAPFPTDEDPSPDGSERTDLDVEADGEAVTLRGEVDARSATELRERLGQLLRTSDGGKVVVDVKDLAFKDWTCLGVLIGVRRRLRASGGDLVLRSPGTHTTTMLELSGMRDILEFDD